MFNFKKEKDVNVGPKIIIINSCCHLEDIERQPNTAIWPCFRPSSYLHSISSPFLMSHCGQFLATYV